MGVRFFIFLVFFVLLDVYALFGVRSVFSKGSSQTWATITYVLFAFLAHVGFYFLVKHFSSRSINATLIHNLWIGFGFSFIVFKLLFVSFLILDDALRVLKFGIQYLYDHFTANSSDVDLGNRRQFLVKLGLGVASIPFASMLYGITKGKYNYKVKNVQLKFPNLPKAFEGFRLVQISDIHAGSFDSVKDVKRGVDLINAQNADVVFFTGDLVNSDSREIEPYKAVFKQIDSEVYAVLGNHDYGDYKKWPSKKAKQENFELLEKYQEEMDFDLLKNEHRFLERDGEKIAIIGLENWGSSFVKHGDLDRALEGVDKEEFKILLSHDPSHWDLKTIPHQTHVDLTLAGHTHGMQFGVDIPWLKWSPVKYKYPRWSGLYQEASQYLYVNRGFGFLGFPGRVGMWPEITVIELTREEKVHE
jgi:predicted MPP superfamily phosphohydrolase